MLNIDIPTIFFEILNFLALTGALYFLLFKPILQQINARAAEKEKEKEEIARKMQEVEDLRSELKQRLANVEQKIGEMLGEAQDQMEEMRRRSIKNIQEEAERILKAAISEADQLQNKAISDHMEELTAAIGKMSRQVIQQTVSSDTHNNLIEELNERIWQLGTSEMDQVESIRRSLDERHPTVFVETAQELAPAQIRGLMQTLSALVDDEVELEITKKPDLIAGVRVRVGDTLINNSIASKMDKILDSVLENFQETLNHA